MLKKIIKKGKSFGRQQSFEQNTSATSSTYAGEGYEDYGEDTGYLMEESAGDNEYFASLRQAINNLQANVAAINPILQSIAHENNEHRGVSPADPYILNEATLPYPADYEPAQVKHLRDALQQASNFLALKTTFEVHNDYGWQHDEAEANYLAKRDEAEKVINYLRVYHRRAKNNINE